MTMDLFLHENLVFVFVLCLVYPMLPVSGLSILDCPLGFLKRLFVLCLVYPMLPVSLDCLFLIAPWVFSNVYLYVLYSDAL